MTDALDYANSGEDIAKSQTVMSVFARFSAGRKKVVGERGGGDEAMLAGRDGGGGGVDEGWKGRGVGGEEHCFKASVLNDWWVVRQNWTVIFRFYVS